MVIEKDGTAHHLNHSGEPDDALDGDHEPYSAASLEDSGPDEQADETERVDQVQEQRERDSAALSRIARLLGQPRQWSYDDLDAIAGIVAASGRPHPGDTGEGYRDRLHDWAVQAGLEETTGADHLRDMRDPDNGVTVDSVLAAGNRGNVADQALASLTPADLAALDERHVRPALARVEAFVANLRQYGPMNPITDRPLPLAKQAGWPLAGQMLEQSMSAGRITFRSWCSLSEGDVQELGETVVGPMLDGIEADLLARAA